MFKLVLGLVLVLGLALIGTRKTFTRLNLPLSARQMLLTGNEFIFVGVALGGSLIGLLDDTTIRYLTPLFSLGLGSIGLIFGIQFDRRQVLGLPSRFFFLTVIQAVLTAAVVTLFFVGILIHVMDLTVSQAWPPALVLGATAACTGQTHLALLETPLLHRRRSLVGLLRYMSGMDAMVGLAIIGFAFSLTHDSPLLGFHFAIGAQWFLFSLISGAIMGFLLHLLTHIQCNDDELLTFVVGMVVLSGGVGLYFELSPLFINMVMGLVAANLPGSRDRIFNLLSQLEKPLYIVFLILAGAAWQLGSPWAFLAALVYFLIRLAGKMLGGAMVSGLAKPRHFYPKYLGLGLIPQSGMVIAMVISYQQLQATRLSHIIVTTVLLGVLLSEILGVHPARRLLESNQGESA